LINVIYSDIEIHVVPGIQIPGKLLIVVVVELAAMRRVVPAVRLQGFKLGIITTIPCAFLHTI
jgi:hypothetical protein